MRVQKNSVGAIEPPAVVHMLAPLAGSQFVQSVCWMQKEPTPSELPLSPGCPQVEWATVAASHGAMQGPLSCAPLPVSPAPAPLSLPALPVSVRAPLSVAGVVGVLLLLQLAPAKPTAPVKKAIATVYPSRLMRLS